MVLCIQSGTTVLSSQSTLRARHLTLLPGYPRGSLLNRQRQRLERTLRTMMVVVAMQAMDVQRHSRALGEALEAVGYHLGAQRAEELALEAEVDDAVWPVGEIDDCAGEGIVQRCVGVAKAGEAGGGTKGFGEGVAEGDTDVFGGVMVVNCKARC